MAESKNHADIFHRHGQIDPSKWDESKAVTGGETKPPGANSTFADRAKRIGTGENKAVQSAEGKSLKQMSKDELYAMATDRDIEGRSSMSKGELIDALKG